MNRCFQLVLFAILGLSSCVRTLDPVEAGRGMDARTLVGERHFVEGYAATNADGTINVVVEIPAGTCAKSEVDKTSGALRWEMEDGQPRVVKYLGYPGNYGMVPRTLLPKALGGDGDPLDVLLLGPALERGTVVPARLVGVLLLLDRGEQDDKLIAIPANSPIEARDLEELEAGYGGVATIVEAWFLNYKGPGKMESKGLAGREVAQGILAASVAEYAQAHE